MRALVCCALLALSLSAQADDTLTLSCTGTEEISGNKESIGIVIDFKARIVKGPPFGSELISVDETRLSFGRSIEDSAQKRTFLGNLDRISGALLAEWEVWETGKPPAILARWSLNCRPAQRMF